MLRASIALSLSLLAPMAASAVDVPFLEDFPANERNWRPNNQANFLDWEPSGGPDDGGYATTEFSYFGFTSPFGGGPVVFRANDMDNASGDGFVGNWNNSGVGRVRAWVRHDTGVDLVYFMRVATSANFPGAVINDDEAVPSGAWTQIQIEIDPDDPNCQGESVTCAQALANVGNLQIGTDAPAPLPATNADHTMDIDKVELLEVEAPEPGQLMLAIVGALVLAAARTLRW